MPTIFLSHTSIDKPNGKPEIPGSLLTDRHLDQNAVMELFMEIMKKSNWDQEAYDIRRFFESTEDSL